ncbi:hypothetical protein SAMN05444487_105119 [Marininema mesophilum]|uniref:Uncharacterized protein n=1 Tax=Marininema mesophilum TaxID=1048340 RepID=A0A1H2VIJ5_9BACL|nr:hypothetical protein [Marininema mesophilum]SDW68127.1 hypothetical protein SAMN05444487_105119 [Marininema mesophilum]
MNSPTEKLLIQSYKELDEARSHLEEAINRLGKHNNLQATSNSNLPEDIQQLVHIALHLSPEQRKALRRFLESIRDL